MGALFKIMAKKILVVEDDPTLAHLLEFRLRKNGYEVNILSDGHSVLRTVRKKQPDLISLDVLLPKMDGIKVCRYLRIEPEYKDIKILMLSGMSREHDANRGYEVGADYYMTKPFKLEEYLEKVRELLGEK